MCNVSIPSKEMRHAYDSLLRRVRNRRSEGSGFFDAILDTDGEKATNEFNNHIQSWSVRDSWTHDMCKDRLVQYCLQYGYVAKTENPLGNGYIDVFVEGDPDQPLPNIYFEITTSDEAGTSDMDSILDICVRKFDERKYVDSDRDGVFVAVAWDRRFTKMRVLRYDDIRKRRPARFRVKRGRSKNRLTEGS